MDSTLGCKCDKDGSKNLDCNSETGDCDCKDHNLQTPNCDKCNDGYYGFNLETKGVCYGESCTYRFNQNKPSGS